MAITRNFTDSTGKVCTVTRLKARTAWQGKCWLVTQMDGIVRHHTRMTRKAVAVFIIMVREPGQITGLSAMETLIYDDDTCF